MPGGKRVGTLSIQVVPDTDEFRKRLKAQLESIKKDFEDAFKDLELTADTSQFEKEVEKAKARAEDDHVEVYVDADTKQFMAAAKRVKKQFANLFEFSELRDQQNRVINNFEVMREEAAKAAEAISKVDVKRFDPNILRDKIRGIFSRETVKVKVDVDADTEGAEKQVKGLFNRLGSMLGGFPNFGTGINPSGYILIIAALAAVAAPLAGLLTSLALAIPGALSLALAPIAAITLGLEGMKAAASTLAVPFAELQAVMSGAIQTQFTPIFQSLIPVIDVLKANLPAVSQGVADMFAAVAGVATSPAGMEMIRATIQGIGSALTAASPGIASFVAAFMKLADSFVNGGALSGLVDWFNGAGASLSAFITKLQANGQLDVIFSRLGEVLKVLLDGLGQIAAIGLETMLDPQAWAAFSAILQGVVGFLVGFFAASKAFLHFIGSVGEWVLGIFAKVAPFLAGVANTISSVLSTLAGVWSGVVSAASGAWNAVVGVVSGAMSAIMSVVRTVQNVISGVWNNVVAAATAAWTTVVGVIQGAWNTVVSVIQNGVSQAISAVTGMVSSIVGALASLGAEGAKAGAALVQGLIRGIGGLIGSAVAKAKELASSVVNAVTGFLGIRSPSRVFAEIGTNVGEGFAQGLEGSEDTVVDRIKKVAKAVLEAAKEVFGSADGLNLNFNIGAAATSMGNLAASAKDFSSNMTDASNFAPGGAASALNPQDAKDQLKVLQQQNLELEIQRKNLELAKVNADDVQKKIIKDQLEQIRQQKLQVGLQMDQLNHAMKYGGVVEQTSVNYGDMVDKAMGIPKDFAEATVGQFTSDLGISGNGALSTIAKTAVDFGSQFIFNVSNIDEAMAVKNNQTNKQALTYS